MAHNQSRNRASWSKEPSIEEVRQQYVLTYREAALLLGLSERTVWSLVKQNQIPRLKLGTSVRILRKDLEAWAEAQVEPGATDEKKGAA